MSIWVTMCECACAKGVHFFGMNLHKIDCYNRSTKVYLYLYCTMLTIATSLFCWPLSAIKWTPVLLPQWFSLSLSCLLVRSITLCNVHVGMSLQNVIILLCSESFRSFVRSLVPTKTKFCTHSFCFFFSFHTRHA